MEKLEKKWNRQYEQLVEYKRKKGHCMVPCKYEQNKSLGQWVRTQRCLNNTNKLRLDRKRLLEDIGFAWKDDAALTFKRDDKLWHQQHEKLLEYKRKNGHCKVPKKYKDDKSLGLWVKNQRARHAKNKMPPDRKELLDALDFVWKADSLATRSSTTDNSDSEAFTSRVGLRNEALVKEEIDQAQAHLKTRSECPSPPNRKRSSAFLAEGGEICARIKQRGNATASSRSLEEDGDGRSEEDSKPSLVTSGAPIGSSPGQEVVQEQAPALGEIPHGWTRVKVEPDC